MVKKILIISIFCTLFCVSFHAGRPRVSMANTASSGAAEKTIGSTKDSDIQYIHERKRLKTIENLDKKMIPYTEGMRFPDGEGVERLERREIPDKTKRFEGMKGDTSRMMLITEPVADTPEDIEEALDSTIKYFNFYDVPLSDVIAFFREKTHLNMILDRNIPETSVTLTLSNVTIRTALKYILPTGVNYEVRDKIICIAKDRMELRIYDIRDLLINLDDRIGGGRTGGLGVGGIGGVGNLGAGGFGGGVDVGGGVGTGDGGNLFGGGVGGGGVGGRGGGFGDASSGIPIAAEFRNSHERVEELIRLIKEVIAPQSWNLDQEETTEGGTTAENTTNRQDADLGRITTREDRPGDLIVVNTNRVHKQIQDVLTSMRSTQHLQVSIEARFIQMSDSFLEDIGIELQNLSIATGKSTNDPNQPQAHEIDIDIDTSAGASPSISGGLNLTYSILKDFQLDMLLNAVRESTEAEVLTSPRITLSNTQRGKIRVVSEISYVASYEIVSRAPQPVIDIVEDGTTFDVRPIVSADRKHVFLEVHPNLTVVTFESLPFPVAVPFTSNEGTTFQTLELTIEQPLINRQELSVTVDVPDRGTLMIGGLGTTQKTSRSGGVPLLSKVPIIRRLFSRDSEVIEKTNLVIILKPTIIIMDEEMELQRSQVSP